MPKPTVEELLRAHERGELDKAYTLELPGIKFSADTQQDHQNVLEALKLIRQLELDHPAKPVAYEQPAAAAAPIAVSPPVLRSPQSLMTLAVGVSQYLAEIKVDTSEDTFDVKKRSLEEFSDWKGWRVPVQDISRGDCKNFLLYLQGKGNVKSTIKDKMAYLAQFITNMQAGGIYPYGDNPATKQVKFTAKEKQARSDKFGGKPFTDEQIEIIFDPKNLLKNKKPHEIWIPLIQLFTGSRVNEIAQLFVSDFIEIDGLQCFRILDEGATQSVKSDAGKRTLPLHPVLIELKIMDFVGEMRAAGYEGLFPYLFDGQNGKGNRQIQKFSRYLAKLKLKPKVGRFGTHSFRATIVQATQQCHLGIGHAYTGHVFQTQRKPYQRAYTPKEMADELFPHMKWKLSPLLAYQPGQFDYIIKKGIAGLKNAALKSEREKQRAKERKESGRR